MPTEELQDELRNNCTYEWMTVNGVNGGKFTNKNTGCGIFLPAAGYRSVSDLGSVGSDGDYWSLAQYPSGAFNAYYLYFHSGYVSTNNDNRSNGQSVRPVVRN